MAGMYPDNKEVKIFGQDVSWPGLNAEGKFTNGDFNDPLIKPSFIPAETINLILDNLSKVIKLSGETPNNIGTEQLADAIKKYTDKMFINFFQNCIWVQKPGFPTPDTVFSFEGYRWKEVDFNGNFFRAKGTDANPFNGGEQGDTIRNITGVFEVYRLAGDIVEHSDSALYPELAPIATTAPEYSNLRNNKRIRFDASRVVPTANENRPRNLTECYWILEKL